MTFRSGLLKTFIALLALSSSSAHAEEAFYHRQTMIRGVNCEAASLTLNMGRQLSLRTKFDTNPDLIPEICSRLQKKVESGTPVTLVIAPTRMLRALVAEQEVIGFTDGDMAFLATDVETLDPVFAKLCGSENRMQQVCVWASREGKYFLEFKSMYSGGIYAATPVLGENQQLKSVDTTMTDGGNTVAVSLGLSYGDDGAITGVVTQNNKAGMPFDLRTTQRQ